MNTKVHDIAMAALLHDIGKFWSRTGNPKPYDDQNKANFGDTYLHALWSGTFIEQFIGDADIARWARNHHNPTAREELLVSLADHLASGERYTDDDLETGRAQDAALVHILTSVRLKEEDRVERGYLPMTHHGDGAFLDSAFMPRESFGEAPECYPMLWEGFEKAVNAVRPEAAPIETWLALLRRFASRIPAATPNRYTASVPDISLFEHSRVTAAIAACLEADKRTAEEISECRSVFDKASFNPGETVDNKEAIESVIAQLVCGDLSGVQEFLYNIPRKGAAKTLRARSFMLQLVASACAEFCCREAGVPPCNILYSGGGRFYLLAPARADMAVIAATLDEYVQDQFGGQLAVIIGSAQVRLGDFLPGKFSEVWKLAGEFCSQRKGRKFSERAKKHYDKVFGCMSDFVEVVSSAPGVESELDEGEVGADALYVEWGRKLTHAHWLVKTEAGEAKQDINAFFRKLGAEYHLVPDSGALGGLPQAVEIMELNGYDPFDAMYRLKPRGNVAFTYRLTANHWPKDPRGENLTFGEIAENATGAKKLAVFRADVDNLGQIFTRGLGRQATAGRVSMLSQAMADFFEGYLQWLCKQEDYRERLGVIYAGGDDVFLVGAWDAVLDFAVELREAFARYAFNNPAFSLSGGVVLVDDHLPVRHFAELAGKAEEMAKGHKRKHNGVDMEKDALTIFDMPFGSEELPRFLELKDLLLDVLCENKNGPKPLSMGFLRRLFEVWDAYLQEKQARLDAGASLEDVQRLMHWQRWRWMLVYGLREYVKKAREHQVAVENIQERILDTGQPVDDRLGMPLRWVELLLKKDTVRERPRTAVTDETNSEPETATTTERE